jgi:hypothetical protein
MFAANLKSITAAERVKSYPNKYFTARGDVLLCSACCEEQAHKNVISMHEKSRSMSVVKLGLQRRNKHH